MSTLLSSLFDVYLMAKDMDVSLFALSCKGYATCVFDIKKCLERSSVVAIIAVIFRNVDG